jgi:hypothetical protein
MTTRADRPRPAEAGTRELLDGFSTGDPDEVLHLGDVLAGLGRRSFGMLLFVSTLPAFIPIPGFAGAASGPLVMLIGLQLLIGRREPWLPRFIATRGPRRSTMAGFRSRIAPWLMRLERVVRPRMAALLDARLASAFTGLQLLALGTLLLLPIPMTNYLFALVLLLFAFALLERDGRLMAVAWGTGAVVGTTVALLSGSLIAAAVQWLDGLM